MSCQILELGLCLHKLFEDDIQWLLETGSDYRDVDQIEGDYFKIMSDQVG